MKTKWIHLIAGFTMFVLCISVCTTTSDATVIWSDDFDDGNYDGWTVHEGNFSAANYYLESTEINASTGWSFIRRETNVSTGTWSFDCYLPTGSDSISVSPHTDDNSETDDDFVGYSFIEIRPDSIRLWIRSAGGSTGIVASWSSTFNETWTHIDVTVDEDMMFDVFVNDVHRIHYDDASHLTGDYRYFVFNSQTVGHAIDNVVVSDQVNMSLPFNTTTPTTPTATPPPLPWDLIAIGGGAAVVVIVLAIVLIRRR
ncbi:MAG: hypothetical protein ACXADF_18285 [Candidatus Thorarchaeota archaeon]|jgi:hypothetical protein